MRSIQFLTAAVLAVMVFTSCQKDTEILPEEVNKNTAVNQRDLTVGQTIQFTSWLDLVITPPECPMTMKPYSNEQGDDQPSRVAGCMGEFGFDGGGTGFIEGFDRYYIRTTLKFDAATRRFNGMIEFEFASYNSSLTLKIEGPAQQTRTEEAGTVIQIPANYHAGTGEFGQIDFEGVLKIMHADEIFDAQNTEYYATLLVEGEFIQY